MNVKTRWPNIYYRWCFQIAVNLEDLRALKHMFDLILHITKNTSRWYCNRKTQEKGCKLEQAGSLTGNGRLTC